MFSKGEKRFQGDQGEPGTKVIPGTQVSLMHGVILKWYVKYKNMYVNLNVQTRSLCFVVVVVLFVCFLFVCFCCYCCFLVLVLVFWFVFIFFSYFSLRKGPRGDTGDIGKVREKGEQVSLTWFFTSLARLSSWLHRRVPLIYKIL